MVERGKEGVALLTIVRGKEGDACEKERMTGGSYKVL